MSKITKADGTPLTDAEQKLFDAQLAAFGQTLTHLTITKVEDVAINRSRLKMDAEQK